MMKKTFFLYMLMAFVTAFGMQSCSDDDDASPKATYINVFRDSTAIDQLRFQIPASFVIIGVDCDADWTASVADESWVTISNHAGYGSATKRSYIRVDVQKNDGEMRTNTITFVSGNLTKSIAIEQSGTGLDPSDPFESAYDFVLNMGMGYNLGNTLDSKPEGSWWDPTGKTTADWETAWGQPVTTPEIINTIAERGFTVFRIPVTWAPHADENDVIDKAWMDRVEEVVNYVLDANCYCILNVQHDSGSNTWLCADPDNYPAISARFQKFWNQIATRFNKYGEKLLFEAFNEILDKNYNWGAPADPAAYDVVNKLEQDFVNTVRATGGYNEYRNLVVNTYSAGHTVAKLNGFAAPADVHPNHILASVHSYDPYNFCCDNGEWNISIFDASCEQEIDDLVNRVATAFGNKGVPFFFGEFGAIDANKSMTERIKYARYFTKAMRARGTYGLWWMGLIDRKTLKWYESEIVDALFESAQ